MEGAPSRELREKWESWASGVLGGAPEQVEAATRAALDVLAAGAPQEQAVLAAQAAWAHTVPAPSAAVEPGQVRGRVADFQQRNEKRDGTPWTIWSFEVRGGSEPPVAVEMRAIEFAGSIGNGDEVDFPARRRKRPMRIRELTNLTSNSTVRVAKPTVAAARATVVGQILATGVAFAIIGGIVAIVISQL